MQARQTNAFALRVRLKGINLVLVTWRLGIIPDGWLNKEPWTSTRVKKHGPSLDLVHIFVSVFFTQLNSLQKARCGLTFQIACARIHCVCQQRVRIYGTDTRSSSRLKTTCENKRRQPRPRAGRQNTFTARLICVAHRIVGVFHIF